MNGALPYHMGIGTLPKRLTDKQYLQRYAPKPSEYYHPPSRPADTGDWSIQPVPVKHMTERQRTAELNRQHKRLR